MPYVLEEKIRIGISACNYGAMVRYNRRGWDRVAQLEREWGAFIWTPVCPEIGAGLGVPRDSVRLVGGDGDDFWRGNARMKNRRGADVTDAMKKAIADNEKVLERADIEAFVFMEGSPTCGVYRTTLKDKRLGRPPGAFGSRLLESRYFLIPAQDLDSPLKWWDWRRRLHAYVWLKRQPLASKAEIYGIWNNFKFLCQEVDDHAARDIGRSLAAMPKQLSRQYAERWRDDVLRLLRKQSTPRRIHAALQKHYAYYRKHIGAADLKVIAPRIDQSKHAFVDAVVRMEARAFTEGFHFAGAPVFYRSSR